MNSRIKRRRIGPKDASESEEEEYEQLNDASFEEESDDGVEFSENGNDEVEENEESTDEESEDENDAIQQELAQIDFATLAKAQNALTKGTTASSNISREPKNRTRLKDPTRATPATASKPVKSKSKNAPQEISSKKPVSRRHFLTSIQTHTPVSRDPRFETLDTENTSQTFRKAYSFIEDYQRDEISLLKQQIRQSKDEREREKLSKTLQSMESRRESRLSKDRDQELLQKRKKEEKEKVKMGKKPFYLKKRDEKKLALEDKYSKLGKKRLEKVLEKKRRKKEAKGLRRMPSLSRR